MGQKKCDKCGYQHTVQSEKIAERAD